MNNMVSNSTTVKFDTEYLFNAWLLSVEGNSKVKVIFRDEFDLIVKFIVIGDEPMHQHDCDCCVFLGTFMECDLYYHKAEQYYRDTVIARYGIDGDYTSGMVFGYHDRDDLNSPIGEAFRRGVAKGFIDVDKIREVI